jgi:NADH-quinone oxidoreductase subunit L
MGGLKKYLPVTYATMLIGTLAIAGIPPLSGFFSKDEILFRAFLSNKAVWVLAVATAMMTAFYMWRLVSMTFYGTYRGPAWQAAAHGAAAVAAVHGAPHPAEPHDGHHAHADEDGGHGHPSTGSAHGGHGPWHGPHESPRAMTLPLLVLAVGAIVAGFVGVPAALYGNNAIEQFLEPSFTAEQVRPKTDTAAESAAEASGEQVSRGEELGLMLFSVLIAVAGITLAQKFYVTSPEISEQLAERFAGAHRVLSNKYYVDELYNATVVGGTFAGGRGLWAVDRNVVDGAVNGAGRLTIVSSWFSGLTDRTVVDGAVNLVGSIVAAGSETFRRFQTGLVQNYALLMLFGIFAFVGIYLFLR